MNVANKAPTPNIALGLKVDNSMASGEPSATPTIASATLPIMPWAIIQPGWRHSPTSDMTRQRQA
ncbi:MAG: hypothetical protein IPP82_12850 [Xanthomonadales bacterium]|nr:hypothetical protein [Xanthomonadales bacterium]